MLYAPVHLRYTATTTSFTVHACKDGYLSAKTAAGVLAKGGLPDHVLKGVWACLCFLFFLELTA